MADGYTPLVPANTGANTDWIANDHADYTTFQAMRQFMRLFRVPIFVGGSHDDAIEGTSAGSSIVNARNFIDVPLDGTKLAGMIVEADIYLRVGNAATTIKPMLWRLDASRAPVADVLQGAIATAGTTLDFSGTQQLQTRSIVLAAGVNRYRPRFEISNNLNPCWGLMQILVYAP